ncbi:hypothetical protein BDV98DRAFT_603270 [Pterulicium gracile]|uniref:Fungal-type protein kinase domain-containing protein n=1 Tax=Pterulicium gracile TaxID=1884261 RepID=A0A5C3QMX7_9AGAR|nr:hypothetical protein BDV98DRAFT_603270 [Pterula gracilis]
MLRRPDTNGLRRGILIDFDLAADKKKSRKGNFIGTPGFRDHRILNTPSDAPHSFLNDITSTFLVLSYFAHILRRACTGEWAEWRFNLASQSSSDSSSLDKKVSFDKKVAAHQLEILSSPEKFNDFFPLTCTPYTACLRPLLQRLRTAIIDETETVTHEEVYDIMVEESRKLPGGERSGYVDEEAVDLRKRWHLERLGLNRQLLGYLRPLGYLQ